MWAKCVPASEHVPGVWINSQTKPRTDSGSSFNFCVGSRRTPYVRFWPHPA
jgi:hypothetical protein